MLRYHFSKLGPAGWAAMVTSAGADDPNYDAAWALFVAPYDLPEYGHEPLHPLALVELAGALNRLPRWALALIEPHELKALKEEVKKR